MKELIILYACTLIIITYFHETFRIGALFVVTLVWTPTNYIMKPILNFTFDGMPDDEVQNISWVYALVFIIIVPCGIMVPETDPLSLLGSFFGGTLLGFKTIYIIRKLYHFLTD